MILLRALVCLIPCLAQPPREGADVLPEGIYGLTCRVVEVRGQDLIVRVESGGDDGKILSIKTTEVSRFSLLDRDPKPEKTDTVIKPIRRADLKAGQKVGVTIYSDGKEVRLLTCVAAGPNLSGEGVLQHVTDLRGKHKKLRPWLEGNRPVRWDIDLAGTKVNDQDLVVLARLPELEILNLAFTGVTDEGLKRLVPLRRLAEINLIGTGVTDASITTLRQFRELRRIGVAQSKFSPKGIEELLDAFPALDLCRLASGKQGAFRIIEHFHDGKLAKKSLMIGDAVYGIAIVRPSADMPKGTDHRRLATAYYHRHGPVGHVLARFDWFGSTEGKNLHASDARLPASLVGLSVSPHLFPGIVVPGDVLVGLWSEPAIGVIRLNAGTHACYGRPFQFFDFYDNTPAIQAFSVPPKGQPRIFDFIHDAKARGCVVRLLAGDERPTLARKGPKQFYSALFVDISREDLRDVNTSLMTKEGMAELMASLREDGLLCYHVSNRYHNFAPPLADAARSLGYASKWAWDRNGGEKTVDPGEEHYSSDWLVVARKPATLDPLRTRGIVDWVAPRTTGRFLWRDGETPDLKLLEWGRK